LRSLGMHSSTVPACLPVEVAVDVALDEPAGRTLALSRPGPGADLELHQPFGGEADHLAQPVRVRGLLHKGAKAHHLVGHRGLLGCVEIPKPDPTAESPMTAASRSLATAPSGARFAAGLLRPLLHHYPEHDRGASRSDREAPLRVGWK
jgi:hypothetical protein